MGREICFWILAGDDHNGVIAIGRNGLAEYLKGLSYQDRQGMQVTPFELNQLEDVLKATEARILILE
jgi:hypothetical protein